MTVQLLKSQVGDEAAFRAALEELRQAKITHMMSESADEPPRHHHLLEQLIKRTPTGPDTPDDFSIVEFEVVNDDPPPPTEEEIRAKALLELRAQEQAEIDAVIPPHKARLMQMDYQAAAQRIGSNANPTQADLDHYADYQKRMKRIADIQYAYAKREAEL